MIRGRGLYRVTVRNSFLPAATVHKMQKYLASSFWTVCGSITGVVTTLTLGFFAWSWLGGPMLILLSVIVSGVATALLKIRGLRSSVIIAVVGAFLGTYGTVASGEYYDPGSLDWLINGGAYGTAVTLVVSLLLSPVGWIGISVNTQG